MGGFVGASSLILVAPVLAYALGYSYFVSYFGFFGLDVKAVGIPIEHYFVQGVLSFLLALFPEDMEFLQFVPLLSVIVLAVVVTAPLGKLARFRGMLGTAAFVPLLVAAAMGAFRQGQVEAQDLIRDQPVYLALGAISDGPRPGVARDEQGAAPGDVCQSLDQAGNQVRAERRTWSARALALAAANECGGLRRIWQDDNAITVGSRWCWRSGGGQECSWQVFRISSNQVAVTAFDGSSRRGEQQ